jgi:hypothetical protein
MDMPIIFLSPPELAGKTGIQRTDNTTHMVIAVLVDDGTDITQISVSYKEYHA